VLLSFAVRECNGGKCPAETKVHHCLRRKQQLSVGLWVQVQALALACRHDVSGLSAMLNTKNTPCLDGFGFVHVGVGRVDFHPLRKILFLFAFAFLGSLPTFAFLVGLLGLLLLLPQLLDLPFQSKNLFFPGRRGIPYPGLKHGLELVVGLQHEEVGVDVLTFLVLVLFCNEFTAGYQLVC